MLMAKIVMKESNNQRESFILRMPDVYVNSQSGVEVYDQYFYAVEYFDNRKANEYKKIDEHWTHFESEADAYSFIKNKIDKFAALLNLPYAKTGFLTVYSSTEENGKVVDNIEEVFESDPKSHTFKGFKIGDFDLSVIGGYDVLDRYHIQDNS